MNAFTLPPIDPLGPINRQSLKAAPAAAGMLCYSRRVVRDRSILPGSMGDDALRPADNRDPREWDDPGAFDILARMES
jgi:hypothetical protein